MGVLSEEKDRVIATIAAFANRGRDGLLGVDDGLSSGLAGTATASRRQGRLPDRQVAAGRWRGRAAAT